MKIERIFNNESPITLEDIFTSILNEKIDDLIKEFYDNNDIETSTDSPKEKGEEVA
ncbi:MULTISPECIES: hypothetical protein [Bacillaceae]|uniref:Uncharacterized protein n=1 Tax=Perspicuibacillus lycopersici TaxID=1325689 RepID=A0AAE3ITY6_9BACI|nr:MULTISPECIES: hypothetical protein [Bacillaceae]MCU9614347.1 hypothetical protein [Perspicuibacillus lycopersici]MEC3835418.1 hypothetical protein [Bacillus licheniformis]